MGETGDGVGVAGVGALQGIVILTTVRMLAVVLAEEIMIDIMAPRVEAGCLGAVVHGEDQIEVEVQGEGTGVLLKKVVPKGELKLSNGIGRRNKKTLATSIAEMVMIMNRMLRRMEVNTMMIIEYSGSILTVARMIKTMYSVWHVIWSVLFVLPVSLVFGLCPNLNCLFSFLVIICNIYIFAS